MKRNVHTVFMVTHGERSIRKVHTVVMVRHGESQWNVEKRFTGWCDVPLTKHGEGDAKDAGALMVLRTFYKPPVNTLLIVICIFFNVG